jgi:putative DNA primase/helicase
VTAHEHGRPAADRERWAQCRLGAALAGRNQLEALEVLTGSGANGKSVLSKLIQNALGDYSTTIGAGVLLSAGSKRDPEAASPLMMMTVGKRIVFLSESGDTDYFDETKLKLLTGNDYIAARGMYQEGSRYASTFTLVLLTNSVPNLNKLDMATIDRMALFEFRCRWQREGAVVQEEVGLPQADTWFRDKAPHDMGALQWMLWWLVQGSMEYWRTGLAPKPADVQQQVQDYIERQDTLMKWLSDPESMYGLSPNGLEGGSTKVSAVYQDYSEWCRREGHANPGRTELLTSRLLARFKGQVDTGKSNGSRVYKGITMKAPKKYDDQRGAT